MSGIWLAVVCGLVLLLVLSVGTGVLVLIKTGVLVRHAVKPRIEDHGSYSIDQGREVRSERE